MEPRGLSSAMSLVRAATAVGLAAAVLTATPGGAQAANVVGLNGAPCAYETIGDAISDAVEGDIVFVSPGTYDETLGFFDFDLSIVGSGATCSGPGTAGASTVFIDGGGTGFTNGGHAEVVDAELILRDLTLRDTRAEADGGLIYVDGGILDLTNVALIDGVADGDGGAIAAVNDATVIINDSFFLGNEAGSNGGAISIDGGSLTINDTEMFGAVSPVGTADPSMADRGGLLAVSGGAAVTLMETRLENARSSEFGGALDIAGSGTQVTMVGGRFVGNFSGDGGAVAQHENTSLIVDDVEFLLNDARTIVVDATASSSPTTTTISNSILSGGVFTSILEAVGPAEVELVDSTVTGFLGGGEGAISVEGGVSLTLRGSTVTDNSPSAATAGGVMAITSTVLLVDSEISSNFGGVDSTGGVFVQRGSLTAVQTSFVGNVGDEDGAISSVGAATRLIDVIVADNRGGEVGGIAATGVGTLAIESSTLVRNEATGVFLLAPAGTAGPAAVSADTGVGVIVRNSIVWDNASDTGIIDVDLTLTNWSSSVVQGSGGSASWDTSLGLDLGGNIDVDPVLDDRFVPATDSPARDGGSSSLLPLDTPDLDGDGNVFEVIPFDFAGRQRVRGPEVDIGAMERPDRQFVLDSRPCVIYDTFAATGTLGGALDGGEVRTLRAAGTTPASQGITNSCIPIEAEAGLFHVRAFDPEREANFRLSAAGVEPNGGVVNFARLPTTSRALENSNTVPSEFGFNGFIDFAANAGSAGAGSPTAGASIHTVGYFADEVPTFETGLDFFPLTPCAVLDSRTNQGAGPGFVGPFTGTTRFEVDVTGDHPAEQGGGSTNCGVPESAEGVILNLVAINPTGPGVIGAVRDASVQAFGATSFADLPMNNATSIVVPISDDGTVSVTSNPLFGSVHIRAVVLGYVDDEPGLQFNPLPPCAAFDSRSNRGAVGSFEGLRSSGSPTTYQISGASLPAVQGGANGGDCGVPEGTTYVMVNLVSIAPVAAGNLRADATGSTPTGGVLNFALLNGPMNNSNAVPIPLDALGRMDVFANGGPVPDGTPLSHVRGVILGYYD